MREITDFLGHTSSRLNEDLCPLPHESILSSLWRFAWRNALSGSRLLQYCKQRPTFSTSSFPSFDQISLVQFESATNWKLEIAERTCRLADATWWEGNFRYCPLCLEHGYHSYWHQSLYIETCPIDGARLLTTCEHCGMRLPQYGICRSLLDRPYVCAHCYNPISGVWPTVESRLSIQCCADKFSQALSGLYDWWIESGSVRRALLNHLPSSDRKDVSHYTFPYRSFMRQWVLDHNEAANPFPVTARRTPRLIILRWAVRLNVEPGWQVKLAQRVSWDGRYRTRMLGIYRATLRRLERLIYARRAFTDEDYRRYLVATGSESQSFPNAADLPLLALCAMRRNLERYLSLNPSRPPNSLRDPSSTEISAFWHRARVCWRIAFIGMYVDMYWSLVSTRAEVFRFLNPPSFNPCAMRQFEEESEDPKFAYFKGSIAFPEIDGMAFNAMIRRSQCNLVTL